MSQAVQPDRSGLFSRLILPRKLAPLGPHSGCFCNADIVSYDEVKVQEVALENVESCAVA